MKYVLDQSNNSLIIQKLNHKSLNDILNLCVKTESVSVALTFKDFMTLSFPENQEYHRQGKGFPYVVYKGILILSSTEKQMQDEINKLNKPSLSLVPNE